MLVFISFIHWYCFNWKNSKNAA